MPLPPLKYTNAHVALTVPVDEPTPRSDAAKQQLAQALVNDTQGRAEPELGPDLPVEVPFLMLGGRSSQIAFSQIQADLELEFYDAYTGSAELCRGLVAEKGQKLFEVWSRIGARPVWEGIVITMRAPTTNGEDTAVRHVLETHLRGDIDGDVHEAKVQIGLRLHNRYFVTLMANPYEARTVKVTGPRSGPIRPWEGEVTERGFEVTLDVNNRYGAMLEKQHMRVTRDDVLAMNDLAWQLVESIAIPYARDGMLDLSTIQQVAVG
jgi:hypothetical protein